MIMRDHTSVGLLDLQSIQQRDYFGHLSILNLGIFGTFFVIALEDRFNENINMGKFLLVKNIMLVYLVKKNILSTVTLGGVRAQ